MKISSINSNTASFCGIPRKSFVPKQFNQKLVSGESAKIRLLYDQNNNMRSIECFTYNANNNLTGGKCVDQKPCVSKKNIAEFLNIIKKTSNGNIDSKLLEALS